MRPGVSSPCSVGPRPYHGFDKSNIRTVPSRERPAGKDRTMTTDDNQDHWSHWGLGPDEITEYTALSEDIPEYLEQSLWGWVGEAFVDPSGYIDNDLVRQCERELKVPIPYPATGRIALIPAIRSVYSKRPVRDTWRFINYLLGFGHAHGGKLKTYLLESGSAYTVEAANHGMCYLEKRVPEGVHIAADATFRQPNGGKRLAVAWQEAFGVNPDPTKAYSEAVKAVEDAAIPVVCPNDTTATLGSVIGEVNAGTWKLPHLREHSNATTHDVLVGMLRTLWTGQHDRHGGPSTVGVPAVTQDEAESAVLLAVTLVGWFETGKVQP